MFLLLQNGRGGGPGRLAERMADRVCVLAVCVFVCGGLLAAEAMLG